MHNILYQVIQRHQTWWNGQNLKFHFLVEKWLSLGHLLRKKNRKSWKHVFYTNWTILSRKKKFSKKVEKKIFFGSFSKFHKIGHISWTTKAFRLIFSGMIVLDSAFQNIKTVFKMTFNFFYKKLKTVEKSIFCIIFEWSRIFLGNLASTLLPTHHPLSLCHKSKKSLDWKYHNFLWWTTNRLFFDSMLNCNVLSDLLNFSDFLTCWTCSLPWLLWLLWICDFF